MQNECTSPAYLRAQRICRRLPPLLARRMRNALYPFERAQDEPCRVQVRSQTGSLFTGRIDEVHGYAFGVMGYFDWRNLAVVLAVCAPGDTIIEIGANVGTETVGLADVVGPAGHVYAFEPLPNNVAELERIIAINGFTHLEVLPLAVGERAETLSFRVPSAENTGVGYLDLGEEGEVATLDTIEISCVRLDDLADRLGKARMMLVDVEGAEVHLLRGGRTYLKEVQPLLIIEAAPKHLNRAGVSIEALYEELCGLRYTIYNITRLGVKEITTPETQRKANWFCVPRGDTESARRVQKCIRQCGMLPCVPGVNPMTKVW